MDHQHLPPERDLPARRLQLRREHVVQEVITRRRHVRRLVVVLGAAAVVLAATGFGAYHAMREPTHVASIGCYDRADLGASVTIVPSSATDPVAACASLWRSGVVAGQRDVPQLTACVLDTGAVAVVPGTEGVCEGLGIASLSAEGRRGLIRAGELSAALATRFGDATGATVRTRCVGEIEAKRVVAAELRARGLDGWTVEVRVPFDAERRCASAEVVPADKKVELVSIWP